MHVTTVIPTYNRARDVVHAVDSALAQRYPATLHDVVVVDDGSTDDTRAVLASRFGDRIRVLAKPNGGVASARNDGLAAARGEAVAFLDSDDAWAPDKLAAQVDVLAARPEIAMVLTSLIEVDEARRPLGAVSRRSTMPVDGHVLPFVLRNPACGPSTVMVRTAVAREVGGFDPGLRTAEDLDFHLKVARRHQIAVVDRPLVYYMRGGHGLSASTRSYFDQLAVIERFLAAHHAEIGDPERRDALFCAYLRNAFGLSYCGELTDAIDAAVRGAGHARRFADVERLARLAIQLARAAGVRCVRRLRARAGR
jgi:glycosyltransferase involved in cell wall biosynthesis